MVQIEHEDNDCEKKNTQGDLQGQENEWRFELLC